MKEYLKEYNLDGTRGNLIVTTPTGNRIKSSTTIDDFLRSTRKSIIYKDVAAIVFNKDDGKDIYSTRSVTIEHNGKDGKVASKINLDKENEKYKEIIEKFVSLEVKRKTEKRFPKIAGLVITGAAITIVAGAVYLGGKLIPKQGEKPELPPIEPTAVTTVSDQEVLKAYDIAVDNGINKTEMTVDVNPDPNEVNNLSINQAMNTLEQIPDHMNQNYLNTLNSYNEQQINPYADHNPDLAGQDGMQQLTTEEYLSMSEYGNGGKGK